jgi:hypothetical protein
MDVLLAGAFAGVSFSLSLSATWWVFEDMTEDDLRWDTGSADRALLDDVDRVRLEVEADSGVPRSAAGGPMREGGLTVDAPAARTPMP